MAGEHNSADVSDEKVNILIVDDRPDKLLAHEVVLAELNQNLVRANSGREALRCLLRLDFAVILLDVNMPGMDGFETAKLIRQRARNETTPIIFISAVNDTETHVSRGYSLGAVDYILTPVVPEILRAKIAVFVDLFKKTQQIKRQGEERANYIREQVARAEAERRHEHAAFLAEASNVLGRSLETQQTFGNLAKLVVPRLADVCVVLGYPDEGALQHVATAHVDAFEPPHLQRFLDAFPNSDVAQRAASHILKTQKPVTCRNISDEQLSELFGSAADRAFVRSFKPISCSAIPIVAANRSLGVLLMFDITSGRPCGPIQLSMAVELAQRAALALENGRLYTAARDARAEAERANRAKDHFLATLSHELRTPLTPVLTSLLTMEDESLASDVRSSIEMIKRNVELEARLIDDLLDLTRIQKGKINLSMEVVDAHTALRNALEICQSDIDHKDLVLDLKLQAKHTRLEADSARLQQVFWNLIKNAVKFTPGSGRLSIYTSNPSDHQLLVEVTDTGCGISQQFLPKIFMAFEQGDGVRRGGLGLGLSISKALVEAHGGQIAATSEGPGHGTTFTVRFPLTNQELRKSRVMNNLPDSHRKALRILLVEDHEDTSRSLSLLLRRRGYAVLAASTVTEAVQMAAEQEFDILVSDIGLPDGSGIQLMQQLTLLRPINGIALTGFGMEEDVRQSRQAGFSHHLVKPVDLNRLDFLIQEMSKPAVQAKLPVG